jgi:4-diphosphocytidyl-2-C-methyl-D-erythritol kinase
MSVERERPPAACRALAPAKINLGLFVGPTRASDRRHELVSVMQSISLADELTLEPAPAGSEHDEILCPGVRGAPAQNLAAAALRAFRASTGWRAPPLRLSIVKRIPVAAGLAGGSADAAATLRLARHASGLGDERLLRELGSQLGADVPAQVSPGRWLAGGVGDELEQLAPPRSSFGVLVLPLAAQLSTAAVYAEADRLSLTRSTRELEQRRLRLRAAFDDGQPLPDASELLHNDLQQAAVSLCPQIADALAQARAAGAAPALVSGSGPTVIGLFTGDGGTDGGLVRAQAAASRLTGARQGASLVPSPICAVPVDATFAHPKGTPPSGAQAGGRTTAPCVTIRARFDD